jgi:hypothetical protein
MRRNEAGPDMPGATATELVAQLQNMERDVAGFFGSLAPDELMLRVADAWTPAEHLDHLNTSVSAVARGFGMPRWLLRLRFGRARRPSRSYDELRDDYLALLAAGGRASGPYIPERVDAPIDAAVARQQALLVRWQRVNQRLIDALEPWTPSALERIQFPHPLLGRITATELVYFTIYHGPHHIAAAQRRLPRFVQATEA